MTERRHRLCDRRAAVVPTYTALRRNSIKREDDLNVEGKGIRPERMVNNGNIATAVVAVSSARTTTTTTTTTTTMTTTTTTRSTSARTDDGSGGEMTDVGFLPSGLSSQHASADVVAASSSLLLSTAEEAAAPAVAVEEEAPKSLKDSTALVSLSERSRTRRTTDRGFGVRVGGVSGRAASFAVPGLPGFFPASAAPSRLAARTRSEEYVGESHPPAVASAYGGGAAHRGRSHGRFLSDVGNEGRVRDRSGNKERGSGGDGGKNDTCDDGIDDGGAADVSLPPNSDSGGMLQAVEKHTAREGASIVRWTPAWIQQLKHQQEQSRGRMSRATPAPPGASVSASASASASSTAGFGIVGPPTPVLTLILIRLDAALVRYCEELSTPNASGAAAAARALDGMRTLSSGSTSTAGGGGGEVGGASTPPPHSPSPASTGKGRGGLGKRYRRRGGCDDASTSDVADDETSSVASSRSAHSSPGPTRTSSPDLFFATGGGEKGPHFLLERSPPSASLLPETVAFFFSSAAGPGPSSSTTTPSPSLSQGSEWDGKVRERGTGRQKSSSMSPPSIRTRRMGIRGARGGGGASPVGQWKHHHRSTSSNVDPAFGSEWDRYAAPFTLLAGAEALYARLEHVARRRGRPSDGGGVGVGADEDNNENDDDDGDDNDDDMEEGRGILGRLRGKGAHRTDGSPDRAGLSAASAGEISGGCPSRLSYSSLKDGRRPQPGASRSDNGALKKLLAMYSKSKKDLTIVSEILCDPILGALPPRKERCRDEADPSRQQRRQKHHHQQQNRQQQQQQHRTAPSRIDPSQRAALSLAATISALKALIDARCVLASVHADIVLGPAEEDDGGARGSRVGGGETEGAADPMSRDDDGDDDHDDDDERRNERPDLLGLSGRCDALLLSLPDPESVTDQPWMAGACTVGMQCGSARLMIKSLRSEIGATSAMLASSYHLARCNFFETILSVKRLKQHIGPASISPADLLLPIQTWIRSSLVHFLTVMPIIFDRIDAYSTSALGFQKYTHTDDCSATSNPGSFQNVASACTDSPRSTTSPVSTSRKSKNVNKHISVADSLDAIVLDMMCKHDQRNGSPLAIAVVLSVGNGSAPAFEHGFICRHEEKEDGDFQLNRFYDDHEASISGRVHGLRSWPAIYLRTTIRSGASLSEPPASFGIMSPGIMRRQKAQNPRGSMPSFTHILKGDGALHGSSSQGTIAQRSSQTPFTSRIHSRHKLHPEGNDDEKSQDMMLNPRVKASEYWLPSGNRAWPHCEWPNVVSLLIDDSRSYLNRVLRNDNIGSVVFSKNAFSYRENPHRQISRGLFLSEEVSLSPSAHLSVAKSPLAAQPVAASSTRPSLSLVIDDAASDARSSFASGSPHQIHMHSPSAYHAAQISENMWIVAIVKGEERWTRRKTRGLSDEEIRGFLGDMSERLRVERAFSWSMIQSARKATERFELHNHQKVYFFNGGAFDEVEDHQFLSSLKSMFGMKPGTPRVEPLKSPYARKESFVSSRSCEKQQKNLMPQRKSWLDWSSNGAYTFFLGPELSEILLSAS